MINLTTKLQTLAPSSVELLDYLSLKSVSSVAELHPFLIKLEDTNIAAIMVELVEDSQQSLEAQLNAVNQCIEIYFIKSALEEMNSKCKLYRKRVMLCCQLSQLKDLIVAVY